MKLVMNGVEQDVTIEHEFISDKPNGFTVDIVYVTGGHYECIGNKQTFNNITEVHHKFDSFKKDKIAFESDIHSGGCTRMISEIETVNISECTARFSDYSE